MAKIEPLGDRVVIKPTPKEEVSKGGIVLPDTAKEKPQEGKIIAVGPGRLTEEGNRIAMEVKKGDKVITSGGEYGVVEEVKTNTVILKISENVKVKFGKAYIAAVRTEEEE
jgi:chaperonin GroES